MAPTARRASGASPTRRSGSRRRSRSRCWFAEAGLEVRRDAVGNVWGRLEGSRAGPVIATGSHIDSQTPGGRYDGALGVVAALVALRTLRERFGRPRRTLEVVSLCEEEASRFHAANFWGSRAITGSDRAGRARADPRLRRRHDRRGDARRRTRSAPHSRGARGTTSTRWIELHIEQGPILEEAGFRSASSTRSPASVTTSSSSAAAPTMPARGRWSAGSIRWPGFAEIVTAVDRRRARAGPAGGDDARTDRTSTRTCRRPSRTRSRSRVDSRHPDPRDAGAAARAPGDSCMRAIAERRASISGRSPLDLPPCPCDPARGRSARTRGAATRASPSCACTAAQVTTRRTWRRSRRSRWSSSEARTAAATRRQSSLQSRTRSPPHACSPPRCTSSPTELPC